MTVKDRVKKYRAKLKTEQWGRLEVGLPNSLIDAARTIAKRQNRYLWAIVREALMAHVTRNATLVSIPHDK